MVLVLETRLLSLVYSINTELSWASTLIIEQLYATRQGLG